MMQRAWDMGHGKRRRENGEGTTGRLDDWTTRRLDDGTTRRLEKWETGADLRLRNTSRVTATDFVTLGFNPWKSIVRS